MFFILVYIVKSSRYILIVAKYRILRDALFCKNTCSILKLYKYFDTTTTLYTGMSLSRVLLWFFFAEVLLLLLRHKKWKLSLQHSFKQDRQCSHKRNIEAPSFNHYFSGITWSITYSERVFVALVNQHGSACAVLNCNGYNSFPHYLTNSMIFGGEKVIGHKMCFDSLYNCCMNHFSSFLK
jgi:hypothetical protein